MPGFPDGVGGPELLTRMRSQALRYGAEFRSGEVRQLEALADGTFIAKANGQDIRAQRVLLATGGLDVEPELPGVRDAVRRGLVRHCPICDAFEIAGQNVALIASGKCRVKEALLLRAYTARLTVITLGKALHLSDPERQQLAEAGIGILEDPMAGLSIEGDRIGCWHTRGGGKHTFDTVYTALGVNVRSGLATAIGAEADDDGALIVRDHQRTSVPGLYAAGDVVRGLSQVCVATGQAAVAATDINASLPFPRSGG
jgi:thioredoxin reductase (NADPH)